MNDATDGRVILHQGFDALYIAFQGAVSRATIRALARAKARAQNAGKPAYAVIDGLEGHVGDTGARGGYKYRFDQGAIAAKWLIKENDNPNEWNLFCEVPAMALAEFGVHACIDNVRQDLRAFDARITSNSVNRFDVAVDIMDAGFRIQPELFSVHSHSKIARHGADDEGGDRKSLVVGGARIETVTVGKMPGRQVTIYDKRKQVVYSQKSHWWKFWGREKDETPAVWRVELRFGKKYLKKCGIDTLDDVLDRGGDLVAKAFDDVRYLERANTENNNATRTKLHGFWQDAKRALMDFAGEAITGGALVKIREVVRADHQAMCVRNVIGYLKNIAATKLETSDYPDNRNRDAVNQFIGNLIRDISRPLEALNASGWVDFEHDVKRVSQKYHYLDKRVAA